MVLIPGCMSVVQSNNIEDCICVTHSFYRFEKKIYNEVLDKKNREIKDLHQEVIRLNKRIEKLYNKQKNKKT